MTTDERHAASEGAGGAHTVEDLWDELRAEERAERLAQVVQDAVRDARLADALAGSDHLDS